MTTYWIIGGYGEVGSAVARSLLGKLGDRDEIVVAGRSGERAERLARELGQPARAVELNVAGPLVPRLFSAGDVVVNTVETIKDEWLAALAQTGVSFIDVSATNDYLTRVRTIFGQHGASGLCLTEVGVSPGLTNLLAAELVSQDEKVARIHTFIEMGMGKHHGFAATKWFFEALASLYPAIINGAHRMLRPANQITKVVFDLPKSREIKAIGVGFSDQISIAQRHQLSSAQTFVSVAPNGVNNLLALLARLQLGTLLHRFSGGLAGLMGKLPPIGPVRTSIKSMAFAADGQPLASIEVLGPDQSELTAEVAAIAAVFVGAKPPTGVVSLPDLLSLTQVKQQIGALRWRAG